MTKSQLAEIIDKVKWIGNNALEQAQIFNSATQFGVAEVMFKQVREGGRGGGRRREREYSVTQHSLCSPCKPARASSQVAQPHTHTRCFMCQGHPTHTAAPFTATRACQAYSISKLVSPEADHKSLAQGLADALFGQGKVQEAKTIMRAAGLSRKGMKQNMPASYLR
jgi:hypothetical protein